MIHERKKKSAARLLTEGLLIGAFAGFAVAYLDRKGLLPQLADLQRPHVHACGEISGLQHAYLCGAENPDGSGDQCVSGVNAFDSPELVTCPPCLTAVTEAIERKAAALRERLEWFAEGLPVEGGSR